MKDHSFVPKSLSIEEARDLAMEAYKGDKATNYELRHSYFWEQHGDAPRVQFRDALNRYSALFGWERPSRILDIGCAGGRDMMMFKAMGFDVEGIDLSEDMIHIARDIRKLDAKILDFYEPDVSSHLGTYHGLWAAFSLIHSPRSSMRGLIARFKSLLVDNGIIFISVKEKTDNSVPPEGEQSGGDVFDEQPRFFSFWTLDELNTLMQNAGFEMISMNRLPKWYTGKDYGYLMCNYIQASAF